MANITDEGMIKFSNNFIKLSQLQRFAVFFNKAFENFAAF